MNKTYYNNLVNQDRTTSNTLERILNQVVHNELLAEGKLDIKYTRQYNKQPRTHVERPPSFRNRRKSRDNQTIKSI